MDVISILWEAGYITTLVQTSHKKLLRYSNHGGQVQWICRENLKYLLPSLRYWWRITGKSGIYEAITAVTNPSRNQEFQYSQKQTVVFIFDMGNYDFLSKDDSYFKTFPFLDWGPNYMKSIMGKDQTDVCGRKWDVCHGDGDVCVCVCVCVCEREREGGGKKGEREIETPRKTILTSVPRFQASLRIKIRGGLMFRAHSPIGPVSIGNLISATKPIVDYLWNSALEFCKEICRIRISVVKTGSVKKHTLRTWRNVYPYFRHFSTIGKKIRYSTFQRNAVEL